MSDGRELKPGDFVRVDDRWHGEEVVGRLVTLRGSEWHVAWIGVAGTVYEMSFTEDCIRPLDAAPPAPAEAARDSESVSSIPGAPSAGPDPDAAAEETPTHTEPEPERPSIPARPQRRRKG